MNLFSSLFGLPKKSKSTPTYSRNQQENSIRDAIVISFQDKYYDTHFRDIRGGLRQVTVAELKQRCKQLTGVTIATMKLKVSGAYIKDDTATLSSSGVHNGCIVYVMGDKANLEQVKQTASGNPEEVGYMMRISKITNTINGSTNKVEEFTTKVKFVTEREANVDQAFRKEVEDLGIYLSEVLMQALISLDGVDCPPEFVTARTNRRQAVKQCQALMDSVDQSRAILKQLSSNKL